MKRTHRRVLSIALIGSLSAGLPWVNRVSLAQDADDAAAIKKIMKVGFAGDKKNGVDPLCKVVSSGKGTKQDADELLKLCKALAAAKPPKGDPDDWKNRTDALVKAAERLDATDKPDAGAVKAFKSANDCRSCHKEHRPPKKQ